MIPVLPQPEPDHFTESVRIPGQNFLVEVPNPTSIQWRGREYWQRVLKDMRKSYKCICAYSAFWIPHSTGNHSIDHFIPKSKDPKSAYEWNNYRYVSARFNSRKGQKAIMDPFKLLPDYFIINFKTFLIKPNSNLLPDVKQALIYTIEVLKLNEDDELVSERQNWYKEYFDNQVSFEHLKKRAPFLAYELERQGLKI